MELTNYNEKDKEKKGRRKRPIDLSTMVYGKVPPQAKDIEEAVLGSILLEQQALDIVSEILRPECFYVDAHQRIFKAILALQKKNQPVDLLTVIEQLKTAEELETVGGPYYVTRLTNAVVSSANIETHSRIVLQKWIAREMIRISGEIMQQAYEDSTDIFDLINDTEVEINQLSHATSRSAYVGMGAALVREWTKLEQDRHKPHVMTGVPTGFTKMNDLTNGWQDTDLILLAARPSSGKTAFAINLALNAATDPYKPTGVGFFSLEMSLSKIIQRMLAATSGTPLSLIKRAQLTDEDMGKLYKDGIQPLADVSLWLDDTAALSLQELRSKARKMKKKHNIGLIIIDYLQLMKTGETSNQNREREVANLSAGIKALAKNLAIPIIALSQLSRDIEKRSDGKFKLSDLRDSGSLEQDADVVMFIHKPPEDDIKRNPDLRNTASIVIAKNRDGELGEVPLIFYGHTQKWENIGQGAGWHPAPVTVKDYTEPARSQFPLDDSEEQPF